MKRLCLTITLLITAIAGCNTTTRNPMEAAAVTSDTLWWRTPYYASTPADENPWLSGVSPDNRPNVFDPWAYDDLQQYSESPVVVPGTAPVDSTTSAAPNAEPDTPEEDGAGVYF